MTIEKHLVSSLSAPQPSVSEINPSANIKNTGTMGCVILMNVDLKARNFLLKGNIEYMDFDELESRQQEFTQLIQIKNKVDAIVMGVQVKEPVNIAQRVHAMHKDIPIVILAEPEHHIQLQQALVFTPFLSNDVTTSSTEALDQLADILRDTIKRKQKRHNSKSPLQLHKSG